ncbi:MAG: cisplatin damage response ATP-dependent DNA ligase [Boseongicola sp.]|nr:MAG: cisplatin damage response ATP-dependent DNA ligase [Boseongicola sp.]
MRQFAELCFEIEQAKQPAKKIAALAQYMTNAPDADRLWAVALYSGNRPKRSVTSLQLRTWAAEHAGIPAWLFDESHSIAGDLAETSALILPQPAEQTDGTLAGWIETIRAMGEMDEACKKGSTLNAWDQMDRRARFVFNKLITGSFRLSVSQKLLPQALSSLTGMDAAVLAHRLAGKWTPEDATFSSLFTAANPVADFSRPVPFAFIGDLECGPEELGDPSDWVAEHRWDGVRAQAIFQDRALILWSDYEEIITGRFPELVTLRDCVAPGTVLDGTLLCWADGSLLPRAMLDKRMAAKSATTKLLHTAPTFFEVFDVLKAGGDDLQSHVLENRRGKLEEIMQSVPTVAPLRISRRLDFEDWPGLAVHHGHARNVGADGLTLKRRVSRYKDGGWLQWKVAPLLVDAVLLYAQFRNGRSSGRVFEFTLGVWDGPELVPVAKVDSGLMVAEIDRISAWVRDNTRERFGPVHSVNPHQVFEVAFDSIQENGRRKSGIVLKNPRALRWQQDQSVEQSGTLADLKALITD